MIEIHRLVKRFGYQYALRGVNLEVSAGETLVLFGPNGAGKTTLLRILATLSKPTSGRVVINGYALPGESATVRRQIGLVTHKTLLYNRLTAVENLRFYGQIYGMTHLGERIDALLAQVGLYRRRDDEVRTFSRGMVQRLTIARALLHNPPILLLDEPDTGLDPQASDMLLQLLQEVGGAKRTIIMTTHHLSRGLAIADKVAILANGKLLFENDGAALSEDTLRSRYQQITSEAA